MERLFYINQASVEAMRQTLIDESTDGRDDDLPVEDRKDRLNVAEYFDEQTQEWKPVNLLRNDDVCCGAVPGRVVGPARGREWVSAYPGAWLGDMIIPVHWSDITARAPALPEENPMPLVPTGSL